MKYITLVLLFVGLSLSSFAQGLKLPAPSPTSTLKQSFSTSEIEIEYSRPSVRDRKIFGGLVPYGEMWRTGANASTKISLGEDMYLGSSRIKAGKYSLYTIPGEKEWTIIINKSLTNWGNSGYKAEEDVARFTVKANSINNSIETFTITIGDITYNSCSIILKWAHTKVIIPVKADNEKRIAKEITDAVENPSIPYYQAARYYNTTNQNLEKALKYVAKATEENPKAFWVWYLKAEIAKKLGYNAVAIEAANKSAEAAKGSTYESEYTHKNQELINSLK